MRHFLFLTVLMFACSSGEKKTNPVPEPATSNPKKESPKPDEKPTSSTTNEKPPEPPKSEPSPETLVTLEGIGTYKLGTPVKGKPKKDEYGFSYEEAGDVSLSYHDGKLCGVSTKSSKYKTKEGLGVGNTFGEFEKAYGVTVVEAATGDIFFPDTFKKYSIYVDNMPNEGDKKPELSSAVNSLGVVDCPRMPE